MKRAPMILGAGLVAIVVLAAGTWWALESGDVATLETRADDGDLRRTHVWFVVADDGLWVEAGSPENPWFVDVQRDPRLRFSSDERSGRYRALPQPDPARRRTLRAQLREKYGLRDWWVGRLVDASRSVPVRLQPLAPEPAERREPEPR